MGMLGRIVVGNAGLQAVDCAPTDNAGLAGDFRDVAFGDLL